MGVAAACALAGCSPRSETPPPPAAEPAAQALPLPPLPPPAVNRAELLAAVAASASAMAVGKPAPKAAADLAGRRFSVRLPFGCPGESAGAATYVHDADKESLKLSVQPKEWLKDEGVRALVGTPDAEAIEGFWIARPWIAGDDCPLAPPPVIPATGAPVAAAPSSQTVGLAAVFEKGGSRLLRRNGRPYEVIRKSPPPGAAGLRLVLEGRIVAAPDGRAIACRNDGPARPPLCLVRVEFDRVAIQSPAGETFGEWRS